MKKIYLYVIAGVLAIAGCAKTPSVQEQIIPENEPAATAPEDEADSEATVVTIKASIEGETKTTYTEDTGSMKAIVGWEAGDKINVVYSNGGYNQYTLETTGNGEFTGSVAGTEGGKYAYLAVYPYGILSSAWNVDAETREHIQITLPDEFIGSGADAIPMAVHSLKTSFDGTYHFKHLGSVIRFRITNIPSTARHLSITSASRQIAGLCYVYYDSDSGCFYYEEGTNDDGSADNTVTYHFTPNLDGSYTFYLPYGCKTPKGNFTFTFKDSENADICSRTTTLGGLASTTLVRNTMYRVNMDAMSFDGYPLSSITINPTHLPSSATSPTKFTVNTFDFYSYYAVNESGTTIKFSGDGAGAERIYNSTSLGTIVRIVITNSADEKYYRDNYILYAGDSEDPSSTTISYSSYEGSGNNQRSTTYILSSGSNKYSHFSLKNEQTWSDRIVGNITIYYKAD